MPVRASASPATAGSRVMTTPNTDGGGVLGVSVQTSTVASHGVQSSTASSHSGDDGSVQPVCAGFVFAIPERYTPGNAAVPTPHEVAPWVAVIERLWDDAAFEARHRSLARDQSRRWDDDRLAACYEQFFSQLIGRGGFGDRG